MQIDYNYSDNLALLCPALGFGGGGGYAFAGVASVKEKIQKVREFVNNESEAKTLENVDEYGVAFYKGTLVFAVDIMGTSALSFGVILMGSGNLERSDFADTLNHEYGHVRHLAMIGPVDYFVTAAIPSLICAGLTEAGLFPREYYYNLPWERTADYLGGVNRTYLPNANTAASVYFLGTLAYSCLTP